MKKVLSISFIVILLAIGQNYYAGKSNAANADLNSKLIAVDDQEKPFGSFFKLYDNGKDNENSKKNDFMIKGTITASSSNSLTINNKVINIDSSVTGNVKIVGNIQNGMYAMVKGIIKDSNYYATKIVVDQRNKHEKNEEEDESITPTITPTGTITPTPTAVPTVTLTPTPTGTESANIEESANINLVDNFNFQKLLHYLENFFTSLKNSFSKV